jgi:hypothetical protein
LATLTGLSSLAVRVVRCGVVATLIGARTPANQAVFLASLSSVYNAGIEIIFSGISLGHNPANWYIAGSGTGST